MLDHSREHTYQEINHVDPFPSTHTVNSQTQSNKLNEIDQEEKIIHHPVDLTQQEIVIRPSTDFRDRRNNWAIVLIVLFTSALVIGATLIASPLSPLNQKEAKGTQVVKVKEQMVIDPNKAKQIQKQVNSQQKMKTQEKPKDQPMLIPDANKKQEVSKLKFFKHNQLINPAIQQQLKKIFKNTIYDAHYFVEDENCQHQSPIILHQASTSIDEPRPLIQINKTSAQLDQIIQGMKFNDQRPKVLPQIGAVKRVSAESINTAYFFAALNKEPNNQEYLQSQFYRYNKLYKIGEFGTQLPLCISIVGRNTMNFSDQLYSSIERQNYTNYRIVHIDDNSDDGTQQKISRILESKPKLRNKTTFVTQQIRRNQLHNRNTAIRLYCQDDDIVLDMDADDWIIGNQVFQLVNSLYQAGQLYNGVKQEIWALYFSHIIFNPVCKCILPNIDGQINPNYFKKHTYRAFGKWRTTQLRTFRRQLYLKIDFEQLIDKETGKQYFFAKSSDAFINSATLELSGLKHLKVLDEFLYFYTTSRERTWRRDHSLDSFYCASSSKALIPYQQLQSLEDDAKKIENYTLAEKLRQTKEEKTILIRARRAKIALQIQQLLQRDKRKIIDP